MTLNGRRVLVVGLGRSGRSAARLAAARGARVVGVDLRTGLDPIDGVVLELGPHRRERFEEADTIVVSPGIPLSQADLRWASDAGKDVIGEIGFAVRFLSPDLPIVAITGTNGKSTVTHFVGQLLRAAGWRPFVGGNLGTPLCDAAWDLDGADSLVVEVSSYQLELAGGLKPRAAVILNLTPDHLARHGSMQAYADIKARLFANMAPTDLAVIPAGDERLGAASARTGASLVHLGAHPGVVRTGRRIEVVLPPPWSVRETLSLEGFSIPGAHNLDNAATASLLAIAVGADRARVAAALGSLTPLSHRMQQVGARGGVVWIDDSKATNLDAARVGITGLERAAVVLLGGRGKSEPDGSLGFGGLAGALVRHRAVITFGEDGDRIAAELSPHGIAARRVAGLRDAVALAASLAHPGDAVLLSPGCASFDEFQDFEHRGRTFAAWVQELDR